MGNKELDVLMYPECTEKQYDQEKWKELFLLTCSVSGVTEKTAQSVKSCFVKNGIAQ